MAQVELWVPYRIGTFNIHRENPDAYGDLDKVAQHFDFIGLQESADHDHEIRQWLADNPGWGQIVLGNERPERQNRILFRVHLVELQQERPATLKLMAKETAGTPERHQLTAHFWLPLVGRWFTMSVDHVNSHIEKRSWWRLPRFGVARGHIRRIARRFRRRANRRPSSVVVQAFDCNINAKLDRGRIHHWPWSRMREAGAVSGYMKFGFDIQPTKGKRWIDAVYVSRRTFVRLVRHFTLISLKSDHNAYGLVIRVRRTAAVVRRLRAG